MDANAIDIEGLLTEMSKDTPCGEDLAGDSDPRYMELETLCQGAPERQVGDVIVPAEEPHWGDVLNLCLELLARGRDLRVILCLSAALLRLEGMSGLRDGLALLHGALERFWPSIHPQLDPDEDCDPLERANILSSLSAPPSDQYDVMKFIQRVREVTLYKSRQFGDCSLRDILNAREALPAHREEKAESPDMSTVMAALAETDVEELQVTARAAAESIAHINGIGNILDEHGGPTTAPDFSGLLGVLEMAQRYAEDGLARRGQVASQPGAEPVAATDTTEPRRPPESVPMPTEIQSAADVIAAIDKICRYYECREPSSPVPLILRRAKRLVSRSFLDIVRDLSPDAIGGIETITGIQSTEEQQK